MKYIKIFRTALFLSSLLITNIAFCQSPKDVELGFLISPNSGSRFVSPASGNTSDPYYLEEKSSTISSVKLDLGLKLNYSVSSKVKIGFGVLYGQKGYNFSKQLMDSTQSSGFRNTIGKAQFSSFDLPLYFSYKFYGSDTSGFQVWGGVNFTTIYLSSVSYFMPVLDPTGYTTSENKYLSADLSTYNISPLQFATGFNLELSYMPDPSIRLFIAPYFQYHLTNSSIRNSAITENLYQIGAQIGVSFNLTKLISSNSGTSNNTDSPVESMPKE